METVATVRVGASDAPHFRARGIPSVICGLTPFNMGAPDEHVLIEELCALGEIYALAAYDYLAASAGETNDGRNL
jgi:succinyl-diaminopimelate desuccinylase